jgi:hypothetical protein
MMNLFRQYQTAFTFVIVVAVLYGGYTLFFASSSAPVVSVTTTPGAGPDQDLVALLFQLRGIRLDNSVFADPVFKSLQDFGKDLVQEPVGRQNPFAPLNAPAVQLPVTPAKVKSK